MPTYDYECQKCNHTFEAFHGMSEDPLETCPVCGGSVKRLIGGGLGVIFKGSGFYVTDNKSSGNPAAPGSGKTAAESSAPAASSESSTPAAEKSKPEKKSKEKVAAGSKE